jgi:hypothetical protein
MATQKEHAPDATHPGVVRVDSTTPAFAELEVYSITINLV